MVEEKSKKKLWYLVEPRFKSEGNTEFFDAGLHSLIGAVEIVVSV